MLLITENTTGMSRNVSPKNYSMEFPLGGPDSRVIRTTLRPPPHRTSRMITMHIMAVTDLHLALTISPPRKHHRCAIIGRFSMPLNHSAHTGERRMCCPCQDTKAYPSWLHKHSCLSLRNGSPSIHRSAVLGSVLSKCKHDGNG